MHKTLFLALSLVIASFTFASSNPENEKQQNQQANADSYITLQWEDYSINELELRSEYRILIPSMPTEGSNQIHLNDLEDGDYYLILKKDGDVQEIREFTIENKMLLALNTIHHEE